MTPLLLPGNNISIIALSGENYYRAIAKSNVHIFSILLPSNSIFESCRRVDDVLDGEYGREWKEAARGIEHFAVDAESEDTPALRRLECGADLSGSELCLFWKRVRENSGYMSRRQSLKVVDGMDYNKLKDEIVKC